MKCVCTLKGFEMKMDFTEATRKVTLKDSHTDHLIPGTTGHFNFDIAETTTDVEMTPEEFEVVTKAVLEGETNLREKVVAPFIDRAFTFLDTLVPAIAANEAAKAEFNANAKANAERTETRREE